MTSVRAGPKPASRASLHRALAAWALGCFCILTSPGAAAGQDRAPPLALGVHAEDGSLEIRMGDLFHDPGLVSALESGLPLRILVKAELWKDGFFDSQRGGAEWRATVVYDPLERAYRVATGVEGSAELSVDSLPAAAEALRAGFSLPLRPFEEGRYYYMGQIQVETLSLTDLGELQRWLHGDLAPAVRGERSTGSAVGRGVQRVLVRMLGIPARQFRVRTEHFDFEPGRVR